jgi:hypothetical protein
MIFDVTRFKGATAIHDPEVEAFITTLRLTSSLADEKIGPDFLRAYQDWINTSRLNSLEGFLEFSSLSYVHGTTQAFDLFYARHYHRRMRCFRGEFVYHRLSWRSGRRAWNYLEDGPLTENDAVVISVPFSDLGAKHPDMESILDDCDKLGVPVLLDLAYFNLAKGIFLDLRRRCIETLAFSLSKAFYGAAKARIGLRCQRENTDDPIDVFNSMGMYNRLGAALGMALIQRFSPDHNQDMFRKLQETICCDLKILPSESVIFGLGDARFTSINRGSRWNRVGIAEELSRRLRA